MSKIFDEILGPPPRLCHRGYFVMTKDMHRIAFLLLLPLVACKESKKEPPVATSPPPPPSVSAAEIRAFHSCDFMIRGALEENHPSEVLASLVWLCANNFYRGAGLYPVDTERVSGTLAERLEDEPLHKFLKSSDVACAKGREAKTLSALWERCSPSFFGLEEGDRDYFTRRWLEARGLNAWLLRMRAEPTTQDMREHDQLLPKIEISLAMSLANAGALPTGRAYPDTSMIYLRVSEERLVAAERPMARFTRAGLVLHKSKEQVLGESDWATELKQLYDFADARRELPAEPVIEGGVRMADSQPGPGQWMHQKTFQHQPRSGSRAPHAARERARAAALAAGVYSESDPRRSIYQGAVAPLILAPPTLSASRIWALAAELYVHGGYFAVADEGTLARAYVPLGASVGNSAYIDDLLAELTMNDEGFVVVVPSGSKSLPMTKSGYDLDGLATLLTKAKSDDKINLLLHVEGDKARYQDLIAVLDVAAAVETHFVVTGPKVGQVFSSD